MVIRTETGARASAGLRPGSGASAKLGTASAAGGAAELEKVAEVCGRLNLGSEGAGIARSLLESIASFVRAETATLRYLRASAATETPRSMAALGISSAVESAYVERFFRFDPSRRLPQCSLGEPVFPDPNCPGLWNRETAPIAALQRYRKEFAEYRNGFLLPSGFVHHVGFYVRNRTNQILLFDFHRGARSSPFTRCEAARARAVAWYLYSRAMTDWCYIDEGQSSSSSAGELLSTRELEVAEAVADGLSNKEVAAAFNISVRTVENHLRSIFAKIGVNSRTRLAMELRRIAS